QMPTATERTCGIASVTIRIPFGSRSFRQVTGRARSPSGARPGRRDRELFAVRHAGLISERALPAEPDLAVRIDLDDLDRHRVALGQHVGHRADAILGDLRDVQQSLRPGHDLDERAELLDALDLADVDPVELGLATDVLDDLDRLLGGIARRREDRHLAVVLDVDLCAGLLLDAADDLAAGTDDLADLFGPDLDRDDPRGVRAHLGAGRADRLRHLVEHVEPRGARFAERPPHDVDRDTADLDVHLERGDAVGRSGDLEVHVAVVVLGSHDVGEDAGLVAFLHQPHRDAGHRRLERYARVHQPHGCAAHRGHRRRAIGLQDLRYHADRVGELLLRRQHGLDRALGQRAVTDLAPARR